MLVAVEKAHLQEKEIVLQVEKHESRGKEKDNQLTQSMRKTGGSRQTLEARQASAPQDVKQFFDTVYQVIDLLQSLEKEFAVTFTGAPDPEWCELFMRKGTRWTFGNGLLVVQGNMSFEHEDIIFWIAWALKVLGSIKTPGVVAGPGVFVTIEGIRYYPDLSFILEEHQDRVKASSVEPIPDVIFEVSSQSTYDHDHGRKLHAYQQAGVLEYWIVDRFEKVVTVWNRTSDGSYVSQRKKEGTIESQVIKGFHPQVEWFWQRPPTEEIIAKLFTPDELLLFLERAGLEKALKGIDDPSKILTYIGIERLAEAVDVTKLLQHVDVTRFADALQQLKQQHPEQFNKLKPILRELLE